MMMLQMKLVKLCRISKFIVDPSQSDWKFDRFCLLLLFIR